jgi:hypothetical protein
MRRPAGPVLAGLGLVLVLAVGLAGCQGAGPGGGQGPGGGGVSPTTRGGPPATLGRAAAPATTRPFCTDRSTRAAVRKLFAAMAAGRIRDLDEWFAPSPEFRWFANSVPPGVRTGDRATDRAGLLAYLRQRHARHERIVVTWMRVAGGPVTYGTGNLAMKLRRTADDLPGGPQPLAGKAAVDCDTHRLVVVAIGRPS